MKKYPLARPRCWTIAAGPLVVIVASSLILACGARGSASVDDLKSRILKATSPLTGPPDPSMTKEKIV